MKHYRNNNDCFTCGPMIPPEMTLDTHGGRHRITCSDCGNVIATGIVSTNGEQVTSDKNPPPSLDFGHLHHNGSTWATSEIWWSEYGVVAVVHGKVVDGNEAFYDFVQTILDKLDEGIY